MKICVSVGHSRLKNGNYTSADGRKYGGVIEYLYCRDFGKKYLVPALKKAGHEVDFIVCPEKEFYSFRQEREYKVQRINTKKYDLLMELHLNASDNPKANGTEVFYKTDSAKKYAVKITEALGNVYRNRGAKQTDNLYILNDIKPIAILLELFFCTNKEDYQKGHGKEKATRLAKLITNAIEKV